jgi:pimeloyl-ACP methyl ester carboxylesterase
MCLCGLAGCTWMSHLGTDDRGIELGKTFFVGGAGSIGNVVGTVDVPKGLRRGKYRGAIEVFGWQSTVGGTLRDLMDRDRNEGQAQRLAQHITDYLNRYPGRRVNIIALSAGTGIAAWALEFLPERYRVGTVVFLGSALSREYDLSPALARIDGRLYCFYSSRDPLLRYGLPITGSVDREFGLSSAAGLYGFVLPPGAGPSVRRLYRERLRNRPYRSDYAQYGYFGFHADSTQPAFVAKVIAPLLSEPLAAPESAE